MEMNARVKYSSFSDKLQGQVLMPFGSILQTIWVRMVWESRPFFPPLETMPEAEHSKIWLYGFYKKCVYSEKN